MRAFLRRVNHAVVSVDRIEVGKIEHGLLVFLAFQKEDREEDLDWLCRKILGVQLFDDENGQMKLPISPEMGILVISQFTLYGNLKKGFRPSFHRAASSSFAKNKYYDFVDSLKSLFKGKVEKGIFGEEMSILAEDFGPASLWLDSKDKDY
ncbi:MAG: D-tyrosyl-tRNA(Tyr) deacylase [Opitutae bacterium]|nr:D-tyrosyl-tRNA(Tyr) deacylase [Opitutae bacterium]